MELERSEGIPRPPVHIWNERRITILVIYLSALIPGITMILFPAAGPILTDPAHYGLSNTQYGMLFAVQIIASISSSVLITHFGHKIRTRHILQTGLVSSLLSMLILVALGSTWSTTLPSEFATLAFLAMLLSSVFIGMGVGFSVTALNAYGFDLFRNHADAAVAGIHVVVGVGQMGAPLVFTLFLSMGFWWGAPLVIAVIVIVLLGMQMNIPMHLSTERDVLSNPPMPITPSSTATRRPKLPGSIWLYVAVAFLYGACEGTFGNWTAIYVEQDLGLPIEQAGMGLAAFWGMIMLGRLVFMVIALRFQLQGLHIIAPGVLCVTFFVFPLLTGFVHTILALGVAGLACSFLFPLSVSLASNERPDLCVTISSTIVAGASLGIGFSANSIGLVRDTLCLPLIFQLSSGYALLMVVLATYLAVIRRRQRHEG